MSRLEDTEREGPTVSDVALSSGLPVCDGVGLYLLRYGRAGVRQWQVVGGGLTPHRVSWKLPEERERELRHEGHCGCPQ